jgi:hypothetical protein
MEGAIVALGSTASNTRGVERAQVGYASQAAEKMSSFVILSEAKNLSSI